MPNKHELLNLRHIWKFLTKVTCASNFCKKTSFTCTSPTWHTWKL